MQLTQHFTLAELTRSSKARQLGLDNQPPQELVPRLVGGLKARAWALLAIGGAGAVITPAIALEAPTLQDVCVMLGFAVLIVRTRVKEG